MEATYQLDSDPQRSLSLAIAERRLPGTKGSASRDAASPHLATTEVRGRVLRGDPRLGLGTDATPVPSFVAPRRSSRMARTAASTAAAAEAEEISGGRIEHTHHPNLGCAARIQECAFLTFGFDIHPPRFQDAKQTHAPPTHTALTDLSMCAMITSLARGPEVSRAMTSHSADAWEARLAADRITDLAVP